MSTCLPAATLPQSAPTQLAWLWHNLVPLGKITILAGDPGLGKSFIALDLAARLSNASPMPTSPPNPDPNRNPNPDRNPTLPLPPIENQKSKMGATENPLPPSYTYLLSAEDELHDTILPRLASLHARSDYVFPVRCLDGTKPAPEIFSLKHKLHLLRRLLEIRAAKLIILDPITSFMDGIDLNSTSQIRQHLTPLALLAAQHQVAILAITHLNKYHHRQSLYRATGSLALAAIARSVLLVHLAPDKSHNLLTLLKSNLAPAVPPIPFRIANNALEWLDPTSCRDRPTGCPPSSPQDPRPKPQESDFYEFHDRQSALEFLTESLANGPKPAMPLIKQAKQLAISERTLKRAKAQLGILSKKSGPHEWHWLLPTQSI